VTPDDHPDHPITLKQAAAKFSLKLPKLRVEISRGRLAYYKIGRQIYTTEADIRAMVRLCRVEPKAQGFISIRSASNGLSETARVSSALAAASETVQRLKNASRNTLPASISPNHPARR